MSAWKRFCQMTKTTSCASTSHLDLWALTKRCAPAHTTINPALFFCFYALYTADERESIAEHCPQLHATVCSSMCAECMSSALLSDSDL